MSRLIQFLLVLALSGILGTSSSFAGPGGGPKNSGDPEIPNSAYLLSDDVNSLHLAEKSSGLQPAGQNRRAEVQSAWSQVVKLYVRWARVLAR